MGAMEDAQDVNGTGRSSNKPEPQFNLHTYFRSSCSARLRIACNLKGISLSHTYINLLKNEQTGPTNLTANPSGSVPTLTPLGSGESQEPWPIPQSVAALEYLEERYPNSAVALMPPLSNPEARAQVRSLVNIVACDIQPVTNMRILRRVKELCNSGSGNEPSLDPEATAASWARDWMTQGLLVYEAVVKRSAGRFSVGDAITLADVCLVPAVWGAERWGVDFTEMPLIMGIYARMSEAEGVKKAHWRAQPDTPEGLRDSSS